MSGVLISIEGISRSGKTEVIKSLVARSSRFVFIDWMMIDAVATDFFDRQFNKRGFHWRNEAAYVAWLSALRLNAESEIRRELDKGNIVLVEQYWFYLPFRFRLAGIELTNQFVRKPDFIFFLATEVDIAMSREGTTAFDKNFEEKIQTLYENESYSHSINRIVNLSSVEKLATFISNKIRFRRSARSPVENDGVN